MVDFVLNIRSAPIGLELFKIFPWDLEILRTWFRNANQLASSATRGGGGVVTY